MSESEAPQTEKPSKKQKQTAKYNDYIDLLRSELGDLRRDVFTGDLLHNERGRWVQVLGETTLGKLKSICRDSKGFFSATAITDHILRYQHEQPGKLLIDLPDWDGGVRLDEIGKCIECKNYNTAEVTEILKDWGARMFRRLYDPQIENRLLCMRGAQGAGKDYLVRQMLNGLGDYLNGWVTFSQERDTLDLLCSSLVIHMSEYDRSNRMEVSSLKNFISMSRTRFPARYARKSEFRTIRNSWIATANVQDLLRDSTGNRRWIILDIERIRWEYPLGDSPQILAEWKKLSSDGFRCSKETEEKIDADIKARTPGDFESDLCEDFSYLFREKFPMTSAATSTELVEVFSQIAKLHQTSVYRVRNILKRSGYGKRSARGTIYYPISDESPSQSREEQPAVTPEPEQVEINI